MRVLLTPRAYVDREAIFSFLNARSEAGAKAVMSRLRLAIQQLSTQPMNGRATDIEAVRVLFVGKYPYKIFYTIEGENLIILHIRHTAQKATGLDEAA